MVLPDLSFYPYPVGLFRFAGDMFEGVLDKSHEDKRSDTKGCDGLLIYLERDFDIVVLS